MGSERPSSDLDEPGSIPICGMDANLRLALFNHENGAGVYIMLLHPAGDADDPDSTLIAESQGVLFFSGSADLVSLLYGMTTTARDRPALRVLLPEQFQRAEARNQLLKETCKHQRNPIDPSVVKGEGSKAMLDSMYKDDSSQFLAAVTRVADAPSSSSDEILREVNLVWTLCKVYNHILRSISTANITELRVEVPDEAVVAEVVYRAYEAGDSFKLLESDWTGLCAAPHSWSCIVGVNEGSKDILAVVVMTVPASSIEKEVEDAIKAKMPEPSKKIKDGIIGYISYVEVAAPQRGKGMGQTILSVTFKQLGETHPKLVAMYLAVFDDNLPAIALYEKPSMKFVRVLRKTLEILADWGLC
ncbi:hypothetical protein FOZ60_014590 [Perkinsus olseni]|uniref:N-acetyltransferase domain-containing protein n=1 Tax=Perkinsus olseni TaxID=32597 RepID=A0A7J6PL21_PEROL|nr:hypothetical protein FOZ60_014590 [Perkinsus olseni]